MNSSMMVHLCNILRLAWLKDATFRDSLIVITAIAGHYIHDPDVW
jgi:hypothetical protein